MRPPPTEEACIRRVFPSSPVSSSTAVLGWASRSRTSWKWNRSPSSAAASKLRGIRRSSGFMPRIPATRARSVPWPGPVSAKEPCRPISAFTGRLPKSVRAMAPMRAAPAVWELEGPTMMGPRMSKMSTIVSSPPPRRRKRIFPGKAPENTVVGPSYHTPPGEASLAALFRPGKRMGRCNAARFLLP